MRRITWQPSRELDPQFQLGWNWDWDGDWVPVAQIVQLWGTWSVLQHLLSEEPQSDHVTSFSGEVERRRCQ